ncbi:MAG: carboxymuconolactone decarboxylase family protein [Planctomycetota bacterium]
MIENESELESLLGRAGLSPDLRLRCLVTRSIGDANWQALQTLLAAARNRNFDRDRFDETLLQGVLFFGFPRLVTAYETLATVWPANDGDKIAGLPPHAQAAAGRALFDAVYGKNAAAVHAKLLGFHDEFHAFVIEAAYGRILSRPGMPVVERELIAVAALTTLRQVPQLIAHARGAATFGAAADGICEAIRSGGGDEELVREVLTRARV